MDIEKKATIVVDLGFGDAGKGTIVDYLARTCAVTAVVRFNGGAQAAHNVVLPDGRHHTFSQFGAGSFVSGVKTHLSRYMLVDLPALMNEARHLAGLGITDALARLTIDGDAVLVTPMHKAANRIRETLRGAGKHGSCGMGIGETMADTIAFPHRTARMRDVRTPEVLVEKLRFFQKLKLDEFRPILSALALDASLAEEIKLLTTPEAPDACALTFWQIGMRLRIVDAPYLGRLAAEGSLVFEGAQGVLLDEWHGFHPFTTWSTTTPANARTLLAEIGYRDQVETIGVVRTYQTRHGAGPLPTEVMGMSSLMPDLHNGTGRWQDGFRVGWLDAVLTRYAIEVSGGVDSIALTHLDRIPAKPQIACSYTEADGSPIVLRKKAMLTDLREQEALTRLVARARPQYRSVPKNDGGFIATVERELGVHVSIASYGQTYLAKRKFSRLARCA